MAEFSSKFTPSKAIIECFDKKSTSISEYKLLLCNSISEITLTCPSSLEMNPLAIACIR